MARILSGNTTKGRPGGWGKAAKGRMTTGLVNKTKAGVAGVSRLFARDPSNGLVANIGTKYDVNPDVKVNMVAKPSPTVINGSRRGVTDTHKGVVNRGTNRRVRHTKY